MHALETEMGCRLLARMGKSITLTGQKWNVKLMKVQVVVVDNITETFDTKKGSKTLHLRVCQDQSRLPLRNSFDYELTPEEFAKYAASLVEVSK